MEISKLKTLINPDLNDVLPILDINGGLSGKPILRKISLQSIFSLIDFPDSGSTGMGNTGNSASQYIQLTHTLASGINPGNGNFGSWTDRPINLIDFDDTGIVTLSNNTFILPYGIYEIDAKSTFYSLADAKLRLFNKTANAMLIQGVNGWVNPSGTVALPIFLSGKFTVAPNQQLALQYWAKTSSTPSVYNYGGSVSDGTLEKYASIDLWKVG